MNLEGSELGSPVSSSALQPANKNTQAEQTSKEPASTNATPESKNPLYSRNKDGNDSLLVPEIEYTTLNLNPREARLLVLHPADDITEHVRCDLEIYTLTELPSYVAIKNARGYREYQQPIAVDEKALFISSALEMFLRYYSTEIKQPTRIWVRYACLVEFDKDEQKAYWTREFSDFMYEHASKVVDMHEMNSNLVETGYFQRIVHRNYWERPKEWYGFPDQVVLPRVCPVRLGSFSSLEAPTMDYQYMPLDMVADEIRIMCIMPAQDIHAPIVIHVAHSPINCGNHYTALSYCWGQDNTQEQIVLNGQKMAIRKNLAEAIRVVRAENTIVPMWIDALSINQSDLTERARQVPRMGEIYDFAVAIFSYIGKPTQVTESVFSFMENLVKYPGVRIKNNEFYFPSQEFLRGESQDDKNTIEPSQLAQLCAGLYKLLTRKYFQRIWILQEVAYASNPTIVCTPDQRIRFDTVESAAYKLQNMLSHDVRLSKRMQEADPLLGEVDSDMLSYSRKLFYFRHLVNRGTGLGLTFVNVSSDAPGFLEALVMARNFESTDPRDKIFALWNLARDKASLEFKPHYNSPYESVYAEFARAWVRQKSSLDIVGAVEVTKRNRTFYEKAPSWVPDWSVPSTTSSLVRKDFIPLTFMSIVNDQQGRIYSADGGIAHDTLGGALFSFENNVLNCTGLIIDQVESVLADPGEALSGEGVDPIHPNPSQWKFWCWAAELSRDLGTLDLKVYDDPLRAAWAMFHGDSIAAWIPRAECAPDEIPTDDPYICQTALSHHVPYFVGGYLPSTAWDIARYFLRGRRPFLSQNGYMGLMPAHITIEDVEINGPCHLAVVAGCSVPLLLRENNDETYRIVGACFVQGWMDGEWIETMMGAESPAQFWDSMKDVATLRIA